MYKVIYLIRGLYIIYVIVLNYNIKCILYDVC